jgi:hypothetical protein
MTRIAIAALFALALPAMALANDWDRRDRGRDRRALHDDLRDARLADQLLQDFERTWAALDRNGLHAVELRVQAALEDETREADREAGRAGHELRRDAREARDDRWASPRERAENRRELADDQQDVMRAADYRNRINSLRGEWATIRDQRVYGAMARKHAIIEELVRLSHLSIREDARELREERP